MRLKPLVPVTLERRIVLGVAFFVGFVGLWFLLTWSGAVPRVFLASPLQTLLSGWDLFATQKFGFDVGMTIWRVVGGFLLAAVIAVPLGIAMGAYKPIEAFLEPFVSFARYLPASAFIPLLILWVGIGEPQKLAVIFIGCFFQLTLMVAVVVGERAGATWSRRPTRSGAADCGVSAACSFPPAAPEIAESLRLGAGLGLDLRHRGRADRRVLGHRPHDHRQPGAARDRPASSPASSTIGLVGLISDFAVQGGSTASVPAGGLQR